MSAKRTTPVHALAKRLGLPVAAVAVGLLVLIGGAAAAVVVAATRGGSPQAGPPANDVFTSAAPIAGFQFTGTLDGATADSGEVAANVGPAGQGVVWFTWTPTKHGWAYITPTVAGGPSPDVKVFGGTELASLSRVDQPPSSGGGPAGVSAPVKLGTTYAVAVVGAATPFDLTIFQPDGPSGETADPPVSGTSQRQNDEPAEAIEVGSAATQSAGAGGGPIEAAVDTLGGATAAPGEPAVGGQPAAHSVWYSWIVPAGGGQLTVNVEPQFGAPAGFRVGTWTPNPGGSPTPTGGGGTSATASGAAGAQLLFSVDGPEDYYRLTVSASGISGPDAAPPTITCTPPAPGAPWANVDLVSIPCTAADAGSGLKNPADASFALVSQNDIGVQTADAVTDHRTVCDNAGNCADAGPLEGIRVDRKAPIASCDPINSGWLVDNPTVRCVAEDAGSGLVDAGDAEKFVATDVAEGEAREATIPARDVCDVAANCTPLAAIGPVKVDRKPPTVTCDPVPSGVQRDDVSLNCTAADDGVGLGNDTQSTFTVATNVGPGQSDLAAKTSALSICDALGNCTPAGPFTIPIDRAAPSALCDVPDAWSKDDVTIPCAATDVGTGLAPGAPATFNLTATLPAGEESDKVVSASRQVCDVAGNCTDAGPFTIRIDKKAPGITCGTPLEAWSKGPVIIDCGATDGGSGVAGDAAKAVRLTANLPAGQEGPAVTDSANVCDVAGNCATAGPVSGVKVDNKAPVVNCAAPTGGQGSEANVACSASDGGSGLVDPPGPSFDLATSVGEGNANAAAPTGEQEVCDVAGNCVVSGPFTASVDRTSTPTGPGPNVSLPGKVTVLAAVSPPGPVPAPYALPGVPAGSTISCLPAPGTVLAEGWTVVSCDARDEQGRTTTAPFLLVVKSVPSLAANGSVLRGAAWRAVGVGFAPGSNVSLELDGTAVGQGAAAADGRISVGFDVPATANAGRHLTVLRGVDASGDPLLVVAFADVVVDGQTGQPPTLPPSGPAVPPDPAPVPPLPTFTRQPVPSTTTTTTPGQSTTTTVPGGSSTTAGGQSTTTAGGNPGGNNGNNGNSGNAGANNGNGANQGANAASSGNADDGSGSVSGLLPATGIAVGILLLIGISLIVSGGGIRGIAAKRKARRNEPDADADPS